MPVWLILGLLVAGTATVVAVASSSSTNGKPADLKAYLENITKDALQHDASVAEAKSENEARAARIKKLAKEIPYIGEYVGAFVDLAKWIGDKIGSAYREEYGDEYAQHAAREFELWLAKGWIPTDPLVIDTDKNGLRTYADSLEAFYDRAVDLSNYRFPAGEDRGISTAALATYGALTLKYANNSRVAPIIKALAEGYGSIPVMSLDPVDSEYLKYGASPAMLIGMLVAIEEGRPIKETMELSQRLWTDWRKISHGGFDVGPYRMLSKVADVVIGTFNNNAPAPDKVVSTGFSPFLRT